MNSYPHRLIDAFESGRIIGNMVAFEGGGSKRQNAIERAIGSPAEFRAFLDAVSDLDHEEATAMLAVAEALEYAKRAGPVRRSSVHLLLGVIGNAAGISNLEALTGSVVESSGQLRLQEVIERLRNKIAKE